MSKGTRSSSSSRCVPDLERPSGLGRPARHVQLLRRPVALGAAADLWYARGTRSWSALLVSDSSCLRPRGDRLGAPERRPSIRSLKQPGPDVALVLGTSDYAGGPCGSRSCRGPERGKPIDAPRARVRVGPRADKPPFADDDRHARGGGGPGGVRADGGDVTHSTSRRADAARRRPYRIVAEPVGGEPIQGSRTSSSSGERDARRRRGRIPSRTPTLASTEGTSRS